MVFLPPWLLFLQRCCICSFSNRPFSQQTFYNRIQQKYSILKSNLPGMWACTFVIGHCSALSENVALGCGKARLNFFGLMSVWTQAKTGGWLWFEIFFILVVLIKYLSFGTKTKIIPCWKLYFEELDSYQYPDGHRLLHKKCWLWYLAIVKLNFRPQMYLWKTEMVRS